MNLDQSLRASLRKLAAHELHELDGAANARVLRALRLEQAKAKKPAPWPWALGVALTALTLWALVHGVTPETQAPVARDIGKPDIRSPSPRLPGGHPIPEPESPAALAPESAVCSKVDAAYVSQADGRSTLDLGTLALLSLDPQSLLSTQAASACGIHVTLERGALAVHARTLNGTPLVVHTKLGDVSVHGTVFRVQVVEARGSAREQNGDEGALRVEVDEGVVEVARPGLAALRVTADHVLELSQTGRAHTGALAAAPRRALRLQLRLPVTPSTPAKPSSLQVDPSPYGAAPESMSVPERLRGDPSPASQAPSEQVWREGTVPAPHIAPEPGSSIDEDGRPLQKPKVRNGGPTP